MNEETEVEQEAVAVAEESAPAPTPVKSDAQELKEEMKLMRDHLALLNRRNQAPVAQEEYVDPIDKLTKEQQQLRVELAEAKMIAKHNDFEEIITRYLPEAIKEEPSIANWLTPTDYDKAYYLAKKSSAYLRDKAFKPKAANKEPEKIGSISGVGSATAGSSEPNFLTMSDEQFMSYKRAKNIY